MQERLKQKPAAPLRALRVFGRAAGIASAIALAASCAGVPAFAPFAPVSAQSAPIEACSAALEAAFDAGYWVTVPTGAEIILIGITGRRSDRNAAIADALDDAARKAALFHGVYAESVSVLLQGTGSLDYYSGFDYRIMVSTDYTQYRDALRFDKDADIFEKNGTVFVRVRYTAAVAVPRYRTAPVDGVPGWVRRYTADIPGYLAGVGFSRNKGSLQKTHRASYEAALVSLLPRLSSTIDTGTTETAAGKATGSAVRSSGSLENVLILETWLDKKTSAVWTLIAAREAR
jgi:hypothetical protein